MKKLLLLLILLSLPVMARAEMINLQIDGSQGKLAAVIQKPEANNKVPMVMLLHGFASKKEYELFTILADKLEKSNIASIRFDFNGHGQSEGRFEDMTVLNEIEDAERVYDYVRNLDYVDPEKISVAGHSQGGVVSSMLAGELGAGKIYKVVLFAPAAVLRDDSIRGNVFGVNYDAANPPETVKIFRGLNLGRNYILTAQPLKIYETAEKFTGPVCLIHGTGDRIVPYTYSERYNKIYMNSELHLLDGADHGFNSCWEEAAKIAADFLKK